jgi:prefoldin subunit 5
MSDRINKANENIKEKIKQLDQDRELHLDSIKNIDEKIKEIQKYCTHSILSETNYSGDDRWATCIICGKVV